MASTLPTNFRSNLRRILKDAEMPQSTLAARMGVTPSYVSQLISGNRVPGLDVVERVAIALDRDAIDLLLPVMEKSAV